MSAARILAPDPQPELALDGEHGLPRWAAALDMGARLPFDAAVERGVLANGCAYYLRANGEPKDRVEISLAVRAGSLDEADDERGIAHMIEHLAFRGQSGGDAGCFAIVRELESLGVRFGSHQNAYTSLEETVYWLHVPRACAARATELLARMVLDARISDADVEAEREIVLDEWRQSKGWAER